MKDRSEPDHKLNILALPNQTTVLFGLIVVVLLGTIFVESLDTQPFMWPLALGLLLLPLRAFLAWPEHEIKKHHLTRANDEFADLIHVIKEESRTISLPKIPELLVGRDHVTLHAFGSPRHWFIAISHSEALRLKTDLEDEMRAPAVHAMFIHELYHFKNGDYWQMGYARELLRITSIFMTWAVTFLVGYGLFLLIALPDLFQMDFEHLVGQMEMLTPEMQELYLSVLPSAEEWAKVQAKAAEINLGFVLYFITNATLPFITIGSILWLFYWRKLLRIREFYADAGVAHTQSSIKHLFHAFLLNSRVTAGNGEDLSKAPLLRKTKRWVGEILTRVRLALTPSTFIRRWFSKHPEFNRRVDALENPASAYDHWLVTALSLGGLVLILDIFLATPLMLPYHGQWPMHFAVLVISVIVTFSLMTPLVLGESVWKPMLKIIGVIVALRLVWLTLTIGLLVLLLIFAPDLLSDILTAAVTSTARYTRQLTEPAFDDLGAFVLEASVINMAQVFVVFASLISLIGANILLLRRLFTWYSFPQAKHRLLKAAYGIIAVTTTFLGLTILNPITTILLRPEDMLDPFTVLAVLLGFTVAIIGLGMFLCADRRYAGRCLECGARISGPYRLGKRCQCGQVLHSWMIAEYEL